MKPYAIVLMGGIGACIMSIDIYRRLQQTGGSVTECYSLIHYPEIEVSITKLFTINTSSRWMFESMNTKIVDWFLP